MMSHRTDPMHEMSGLRVMAPIYSPPGEGVHPSSWPRKNSGGVADRGTGRGALCAAPAGGRGCLSAPKRPTRSHTSQAEAGLSGETSQHRPPVAGTCPCETSRPGSDRKGPIEWRFPTSRCVSCSKLAFTTATRPSAGTRGWPRISTATANGIHINRPQRRPVDLLEQGAAGRAATTVAKGPPARIPLRRQPSGRRRSRSRMPRNAARNTT